MNDKEVVYLCIFHTVVSDYKLCPKMRPISLLLYCALQLLVVCSILVASSRIILLVFLISLFFHVASVNISSVGFLLSTGSESYKTRNVFQTKLNKIKTVHQRIPVTLWSSIHHFCIIGWLPADKNQYWKNR